MKKLLFCISFFCTLTVNSQTYDITFAGTGESSYVSTVRVENLMTGASLTLNGSDILRLNVATGVNSIEDNKSSFIKIYPNQATDYAILDIYPPVRGEATVTICDMTGKPIARIQSYLDDYRKEFRLSGLSSGFYLISVQGDSYQYSGKLLCNNKTEGNVRIEETSINKAVADKTSKTDSKGTQFTVDMAYTTGDRLKFTGTSEIYSTVKIDIPTSDKTITFNFIACTDGDNKNYPVVEIGSQIWMAENLKTTKYSNGDLIATTIPATLDISGESTPKYQWAYNGDESNATTYGRLYTWDAVTDSRSVCPTGWHVPTDAEWAALTTSLGGEDVAGGKLKETRTTHWLTPNTGATDESGFTALPGGFRSGDGAFLDVGKRCPWWSASEGDVTIAWLRYVYYSNSKVGRDDFIKKDGFFVRCLKDKDNGIPPSGEWVINTGFGKLVFTLDASGTTITKMDYLFSNFTCGPVTLNGGLTISPVPAWPVTNGSFSITNKFDPSENQIMNVNGTYDGSGRKFFGTWTFNSYGTICSGTWEASAPI
jgi:uncharacterized protein (TIGR02145 family)